MPMVICFGKFFGRTHESRPVVVGVGRLAARRLQRQRLVSGRAEEAAAEAAAALQRAVGAPELSQIKRFAFSANSEKSEKRKRSRSLNHYVLSFDSLSKMLERGQIESLEWWELFLLSELIESSQAGAGVGRWAQVSANERP